MTLLPGSRHLSQSIEPQLAQIVEAAIGRLQDGHGIDVDALAGAHPEFAAQLRELLPTMHALIKLGDHSGRPIDLLADEALANKPLQGQLGDFRLIRELGRGGMGTVYEAEQLSMGRRVALKVLPFAALAHEKSLQRFRNEVRAAAALDHPHIVSVYSVGEDRGIHYFAMQLIRGQTLAEYIAGLKASRVVPASGPPGNQNSTIDATPTPDTRPIAHARESTAPDPRRAAEHYRTAARLGIQAAEALQHAHDQGVLHRDIKPGNLMLDGEGKLSVTDFGLARIEADAGMTMTGDMIGTLRYMAPEQALAKRVVIDQRADVYSLGATLYELLTLEPAFDETDRSALLKQIAFAEPKPLRKIDRNIPIDLETIILKAIAKSRDDRYHTAQQLAVDLRRFTRNQPIMARNPGRIDRGARWVRRNPTVATLLATILIFASLALLGYVRANSALILTKAALSDLGDAQAINERQLYAAHMRLAQQELQHNEGFGMLALLDKHPPSDGGHDLRGWEWHYLLSCGYRELGLFEASGNDFYCLAWDPDDQLLAAAGTFGVFVMDPVSGRRLWTEDIGESYCVCWSPDGTRLAVTGANSPLVVSIRESTSGRWLADLDAHQSEVSSVAWSPDGRYVATGSEDGICRVWDAATSQIVQALGAEVELPLPSRCLVAWLPGSRRLATAQSGQPARIWQWQSRRELRSFGSFRQVEGLAVSPDGRRLAISRLDPSKRGRISVFDIESGLPEQPLDFSGDVCSIAYTPDSRKLVVGTRRQGTQVLDASSGIRINRILGNYYTAFAVAVNSNGRVATGCVVDGVLKIWDIDQPPDALLYRNEAWTGPIVFSPTGSRLACGVNGNHVAVIDVATGIAKMHFKSSNRENFRPAWSADGRWIAWAAEESGKINVVDANTGVIFATFDHGASVSTVELSPDGSLLASASDEAGQIRIWNIESGQLLHTLDADSQSVHALAWRSHGHQLAAAGWNRGVSIWSTRDWELESVVESLPRKAYTLAWSPNGSKLAAGGWTQSLLIWDAITNSTQRASIGHSGAITSLAWPEGEGRLISTGSEGSIKVWTTDVLESVLCINEGRIYAGAACNPKTGALAAVSDQGLKIWSPVLGRQVVESGAYERGRNVRRAIEDWITEGADAASLRTSGPLSSSDKANPGRGNSNQITTQH